ncbi:AAA family ATPase [Roseibium sp.]|uniref:AAA family ATPase n=1 Tax=Roseibium sp. TaxID=1936156 RepID=UPI0032990CF2
MRLENLRLSAFRRFADPTNIQLSGKMVAITGPNEAGKSSLLKSLSYFNHNKEVPLSDKTLLSESDVELKLSFFLEEDDLAEANISEPTWFHWTSKEDGRKQYSFDPWPKRDISRRAIARKSLLKLSKSKVSQNKLANIGYDFDIDDAEKILEILLSEIEFEIDEITLIQEFFDGLPESTNLPERPAYLKLLSEQIQELLRFEEDHNPDQFAFKAIRARIPKFLEFSRDYREIELPYNISLLHHAQPASQKAPSKPLQEIIRRSGLDLEALISAQAAGGTGITEGLISAANERLREISEGVWSQSDACLYFKLDGTKLDLLVENKKGFDPRSRFTNLSSRSDGYRQFVALQVFIFLHEEENAVLLIDEIEHHLHYDAQADLVQHLQSEPSVKKVIYTTHSAGALPEDLGQGVRLVSWDSTDPKKSRVTNKFWNEGQGDGFRPLLFGMGASTFAFFPTRKALIAEGPTELLILPQLMREAISSDSLDFQVVHGLSNVAPAGFPELGSTSNGVVFLVDNDSGGRALAGHLKDCKIDDSRIFSIKNIGPFDTIEDLVDPNAWMSAVNLHIDKFGRNLGITDHIVKVPHRGRIRALPKELQKEKISFAYNLLDSIFEYPDKRLLSKKAETGLKNFTFKVKDMLEHISNVND